MREKETWEDNNNKKVGDNFFDVSFVVFFYVRVRVGFLCHNK